MAWDAPVTRVEVGGGYAFARHLLRQGRLGGSQLARGRGRSRAKGFLALSDGHGGSSPRRLLLGVAAAAAATRLVPPRARNRRAARTGRDPAARRRRRQTGPSATLATVRPTGPRVDGQSVVSLRERAPSAAFEAPAKRRARLDQRNEALRAARAGRHGRHHGRLPEQGRHLPQRLLALERPALRPRTLRAGRSKSVLFDRPGIVRVFCDIHSHMNAFILVFATGSSR